MDDNPECFFCSIRVTEEDYCYGCREYVCQMCSVNESLLGPHGIEEHQEESLA